MFLLPAAGRNPVSVAGAALGDVPASAPRGSSPGTRPATACVWAQRRGRSSTCGLRPAGCAKGQLVVAMRPWRQLGMAIRPPVRATSAGLGACSIDQGVPSSSCSVSRAPMTSELLTGELKHTKHWLVVQCSYG